jgi:hypothetical protein
MIKSNKFIHLWLILLILSTAVFSKDNSEKIKKLSKKADVILTGKVTEKQSSWNASKTRIYTKTTVEVDEYLKGSHTATSVEIITPGGEVGDVGELYTHMPTFRNNEEVVVFLKKDLQSQTFKVLNGEAGKISVFEDATSGQKVTSSNIPVKQLKSQIKNSLDQQ